MREAVGRGRASEEGEGKWGGGGQVRKGRASEEGEGK